MVIDLKKQARHSFNIEPVRKVTATQVGVESQQSLISRKEVLLTTDSNIKSSFESSAESVS